MQLFIFLLFVLFQKDCQLDSTGPALKIDQGGIVQVFDITNLNNISIITTLKSDRPYAGFGSKIKVNFII
jgi:hypothetical protein